MAALTLSRKRSLAGSALRQVENSPEPPVGRTTGRDADPPHPRPVRRRHPTLRCSRPPTDRTEEDEYDRHSGSDPLSIRSGEMTQGSSSRWTLHRQSGSEYRPKSSRDSVDAPPEPPAPRGPSDWFPVTAEGDEVLDLTWMPDSETLLAAYGRPITPARFAKAFGHIGLVNAAALAGERAE